MTIDQISNDFVRDIAAMSPMAAVYIGRPSDRLLDDFSPAGLDEVADLARRTLAAVADQPIGGEAEHVAADVITERLQLYLDRHEAGDFISSLNVLASPVQDIRMLFDLLPKDSDDDYADLAARMKAVPEAFAGYEASLLEGVRRGRVSAIAPGRQVRRAVRHLLGINRRRRLLRLDRRGEWPQTASSPRS